MTIEAMKLALEALDGMAKDGWLLHGPEGMDTAQTKCVEAIAALRAAIEQAERNQFNPDWNAMAVMVEEQQRMAMELESANKRLHELAVYCAEIEQAEKQVDKEGSPCSEFWDWLPKAYNFEGVGNFTKYNMEVAFLAGKQSVEQAKSQRLDNRKLIRMRQAAWRNVKADYKQDPELCFALGFDAGYDAVALRVEPPAAESGAGFESLPASPIAPEEKQKPVAWADKYDIEREGHDFYVNRQQPAKDGVPLYTAPPHFLDPAKVARLLDEAFERGKKEAISEQAMDIAQKLVDSAGLNSAPPQREWHGLTDKEYEQLAEQHVTNCYFDTLTYAKAIEAKLKEKNA